MRIMAPGVAAFVGALVALSVAACSGGRGDGGSGGGSLGGLVAVSYATLPTGPGGGSGPNAGEPIPEVFPDQALEFTFDAPISDGIFGGFIVDPASGQPQVYFGAAGDGEGEIPYLAYADQQAAVPSLQIRENSAPGAPLVPYLVGRHLLKPDTLVVDPDVLYPSAQGPVFLTGYQPQTEYVFYIPPGNGILVGGVPARSVGPEPGALPMTLPPGAPLPSPSPVYRSGTALAPDPELPVVGSITLASGAAGSLSDPAPVTDAIVLTFSKRIDPASVDLAGNLVVFNDDTGTQVPGSLVFDPSSSVATFTPDPGFGPGEDPLGGSGYDIEVRVGSFGQPPGVSPPILGLPTGYSPATTLPLGNALSFAFVTAAAPGAPGALTVVEDFATVTQKDAAFTPSFAPVVWGGDPTCPGQLLGQPINGSPLATYASGFPNSSELGSRVQVTVTPLPLSGPPGSPVGLIAPFDDAFGNCLGYPGNPAGCVNPQGGCRIMHGYEAVDLANTLSSLELVEWGPVQNYVVGTIYPQFQAWCGMTDSSFPLVPLGGGCCGLSFMYSANYDRATHQPADPGGQGGVQCTPGAISYDTGGSSLTPSGYFPFPVFTEPFDYFGGGPQLGNLVLEMNIEPGNQLANFNRYRATANSPRRTMASQALSSGVTVAQAYGFVIYDMRFTFVTMESQGQSLFYDSGVPVGESPSYTGVTLRPSPDEQPPGTRARWEIQGATALSGPGTPASGASSAFLTLFEGDPATGTFDPGALAALDGHRFFRYRATLRNENLSNANQAYSSLIVAVTY